MAERQQNVQFLWGMPRKLDRRVAGSDRDRDFLAYAINLGTAERIGRWLQRRRFERLKTRIVAAQETVCRFAYHCGFAKQSHLTACFKQQLDVSLAQAQREGR